MAEAAKDVLLSSVLFGLFQHALESVAVSNDLRLWVALDDGQRFLCSDEGLTGGGGDLAPIQSAASCALVVSGWRS